MRLTIRTISKIIGKILLYLFKENRLAMLWKDFTTDEINKKSTRNVIRDTIIVRSSVRILLIIDDISSRQRPKKIERLKDTFVIVAGAREVKAVNTSFWNFEKLEVKILRRNAAD
jgi:hypothetical protein